MLLRREILLTRVLIATTLVASVFLTRDVFGILLEQLHAGSAFGAFEQSAFIGIVYVLIYGNLVYQFARLGYLHRREAYRPAPPEVLEAVFEGPAPALVVLVPSYKEELRIVRQTLLSAALQEYPNRRLVLLIDDPPRPEAAGDVAALTATRELPDALTALLEKPARRFGDALEAFLEREARGELDPVEETMLLAELHAEAAAWFEEQATRHSGTDHTDALFVDLVLREPARAHRERSLELERAGEMQPLEGAPLRREHRRLASRFRVTITSFERKRYANLSHEPNKAMNLNSYIGLLGGAFREVPRRDGLHLERCAPGSADLLVPDAEYLITLDADSILSPDYALRLSRILAAPGNERVAVVQTPYSAVPGAAGVLERVAGATTDMQYIVHQGFTRYDATYWVGANAMLRRVALDDIRTLDRERGYEIARYIQDRTVIEDTESSVDLVAAGWTLHNHPERLAYSATPPDFGALVIQRRRWANGGLLILPKLVRHLARGPWRPRTLAQGLMQAHYLVSIAGVNLGLLLLLTYPFEEPARQLWIPATALPYYLLYGRDLLQAGYRASDLPRVYAINLLLLPVNLAGVLRSLHQGWTGRKSPFGRTPKVESRTAVPPLYVLAQYGLLGVLAVGLGLDLWLGRWLHAAFLVFNGGMLLYAVAGLMGARESLQDLRLAWAHREARPAEAPAAEAAT